MRTLLLILLVGAACTRDVPVADDPPRSCCAFPTDMTAKVLRKDGSPVAGVQVEFRRGGGDPRWADVSDEKGIATAGPGITGTFEIVIVDPQLRWTVAPEKHIVELTRTESPSVVFTIAERTDGDGEPESKGSP